jgi:transcriptional regulator with XRE-family HTH domain
MYPNLKLQLWKCGMRQNRLAQLVGIHETLLSKILNGFREPDATTRTRIAQLLNCDAAWLFLQEIPELEVKQHGEPTGTAAKTVDGGGV